MDVPHGAWPRDDPVPIRSIRRPLWFHWLAFACTLIAFASILLPWGRFDVVVMPGFKLWFAWLGVAGIAKVAFDTWNIPDHVRGWTWLGAGAAIISCITAVSRGFLSAGEETYISVIGEGFYVFLVATIGATLAAAGRVTTAVWRPAKANNKRKGWKKKPIQEGSTPAISPDEAAKYADTPVAMFWTVLFALLLAALAVDSLFTAWDGVQAALDPDGPEAQAIENGAQNITTGLLWASSAGVLVLFGVIPTAWVGLTRVKASATWRYLKMDGPDIGKQIGFGLLLGIGLWLAVIVLNVLQLAITGELSAALETNSSNGTDESAVTNALLANLTWPLAIFIALVAGVAEEIFFRGVLQRWIGVWGQGVVFGLTHAGYGTIGQIVFPFILGIVFGYLVKRGKGMWLVIAAHFMFDFVQLALALLVGTG